MLKLLSTLAFLLLLSGIARAQDGFEKVACGSDIPAALIGKQMSNEPLVATEGRHKALALKELGADEISDRLTTISWLICGSEYMVLVDSHSKVRDVLAIPPHSKSAPEFSGSCRIDGKEQPGIVVAILDGKTGASTDAEALLAAQAAWKIDEQHSKFVKLATEGLRCPRSGIITADIRD